MGHTDPAALPSASFEEMKKDHDGKTPKLDAEGRPLCPICEAPCVASGLTWSCPTHTELVFALIDTLVSNETVEMAVNAADSARFTAHPNGVVVRCNTPEEGGGFSAWIGTESAPEIHGVGTGDTEAAAVLSLAGLLADFVRGHAKRIEELEFDRVPVLAVATAIPKIVCADCAWRHGVEMAKDSETGDAPAAPGKMVCSVCGLMFEGAFAIASPERVDVARASQPVTDFTRLVLARERVQAESLRLHFPEAR